MTTTIDKSPAAIGNRRAASASALGNNALEGKYFDETEMAIVDRYVSGEIDLETLGQELLALPIR